ncbi:hypothetical protein [Flavobacterium sp.]|uniref:hypothetical protein n=1 Tax=Flavobacterium sp. TaxID=239 RepID=UPI00286C754A|nr:hypothetical protein [Flavobacterium sp.]
MSKIDLTQLTHEELQIEIKKRKTSYQIGAFIVGMMIGCAVWSTVKNGIGFFIFVPFVFAYWFKNTKVEYDEIKNELQSRQ